MIRLEMKNYDMILKKEQKYQYYHLKKLTNIDILQVRKYYFPIPKKMIDQAKCTYFSLQKALENQAKEIEDYGEQ